MNLTISLALGLSGAIEVDKSPPLFDVYEPRPLQKNLPATPDTSVTPP
jgi:hypothetical protein